MSQVKLCASVIVIIISVSAASVVTKKPFLMFRPDEFFNPFTETGVRENKPGISSQAHQPNYVFGEPNTAFSQPIRANGLVGYPRTIGHTSGNADELQAQLYQPNTFFRNFPERSYKPVAASAYRQHVNTEANPQQETPFVEEKIQATLPKIRYLQHQEVIQAKTSGLPQPYRNVESEPGNFRGHESKEHQTKAFNTKLVHAPTKVEQPYRNVESEPSSFRGHESKEHQTKASNTKLVHAPTKVEQPSRNLESEPSSFRGPESKEHQTEASNTKLVHAQTKVEQPYRNVESQPSSSRVALSKLSEVSAPPNDVVGHASRLVAQSSEVEAHPSSHSGSKSAGVGQHKDAGYHDIHGDKEVKEYKLDHHHNKGDHEKHGEHNKKSHHQEKGGNVEKHHDEAGHYKKHHEGKKSHKSAKFGEKKGHKRGHKTKGYHNKFHRDEYHREHRFYDDSHREGHHEKNGDSHSHYKKNEGGHKNGGGHKSGHNSKKHGKKGSSKKGKLVEEDKGFSREGGKKKYQKRYRDLHNKHGSVKGKKYGYRRKD